jgi:hypothetical protein
LFAKSGSAERFSGSCFDYLPSGETGMTQTVRRRLRWLTPIPFLILVGCSRDDQRLVDLSRQSLDRQAEQNRLVETNNQQITDATKRLIEADADSRRENTRLHHDLQAERTGVNQQRDALEQERREIASERNRDPIVAESIKTAVGLIVAALPLVICLFLVRGLFHKSDDEAVADLLVEQLLSHDPILAELNASCVPAGRGSQAGSRLTLEPALRIAVEQPVSTNATGILVVVEGTNDAEFLRRISRVLVRHGFAVPDLNQLEVDGRLTFMTASAFPVSIPALPGKQFHLYDREVPPITGERQRLAEALNRQPNCKAVLTSKRAIENYLHPDAVQEASGLKVSFGDSDDVAELVARASLQVGDPRGWESLPKRGRRRLRDKAKKWLNREAADRMTPARLIERDADGEITGWLRTIAELAGINSPKTP